MTSVRLWISVAVCVFWALAVFALNELEAMARRAWHRITCALMQCDEAQR